MTAYSNTEHPKENLEQPLENSQLEPYLQSSYTLYQNLINSNSGFIARQNQWQMIVQIAYTANQAQIKEMNSVLNLSNSEQNITVIEAATGIGKSMAYLVGLVSAYKACQAQDSKSNKKIVISTATKVLQSQLFNKDVPSFIRSSKIPLKVGLAKGRSSYLCPYKLKMSHNQNELFAAGSADSLDQKLDKINTLFYDKCWSGDLDELPSSTSQNIRSHITIETHECLHGSCEFNKKGSVVCPYYKNKEHLRQCDVIITNHSLLLTHLQAGDEGNILPITWEQTLLCVDEAHNFNNYAVNSCTSKFNIQQSINLLSIMSAIVYDKKRESFIYSDIPLCKEVAEHTDDLILAMQNLIEIITKNLQSFKQNSLLINDYISNSNNILPQHLNLFIQIHGKAHIIWEPLQKIQNKLKENAESEARGMQLGFYSNALKRIIDTMSYIINQDDSSFNANARWISTDSNEEFTVTAGVTHVGNILLKNLWNKVYSACLVSASLTVQDSFNYTLNQLGLINLPNVTTLKLNSHFNYQEQARLLLAEFVNAPDYQSLLAFNNELTAFLSKTLDYKASFGTLVMFFNKKQMLDVYKNIPYALKNKILLQTDYLSLQRMIDDHKKQIDKGIPSIIFGMNSLAEGVDLVAKYCMHVIITKMPFDTPNDPYNIVREYWIKKQDGNFFMEVSIPEAGLKLIQAAGRLIRTETDHGQITICDNRLTTKFYGKILLAQLAHFPRITLQNNNFLEQYFNN